MRLLRSILVTVVATLLVVFACLYWMAPIALSFYATRKAPAVARVVPANLKDVSISRSPGTELSYFGYNFEVPWADLDETKTKLYPDDKAEKNKVVLDFRSGLRMAVTALPEREFASGFITGDIGIKVSPAAFEVAFGHEAASSDYAFTKRVFEFTPDKMHHWTLQPGILALEESLLVLKSMMPSKAAETGIFNVSSAGYRGFQQGDPRIRQDRLLVCLYSYSNDGGIDIGFFQKNYASSAGVTQPEINRIIQSLHRVRSGDSVAQR